jgi:WXG100 family type VII secretion target
MSTLHMDVGTCREVHTKMTSAHEQITQQVSGMSSSVNATVNSAWQGQSANEFQTQYDQLRSSITSQLETLQGLAARLKLEIDQWEQMAQKLG